MRKLVLALLLLSTTLASLAEEKPQLSFSGLEYPGVSFSRDGSRLLVFEEGGRDYWVWDVQSKRLVANQKLDYAILGAGLSPDGKLLALGERPRRLAVLNLANKERVFLYEGPAVAEGKDTGGYNVAWSPKGDMLAACGTGFMREAGEPKCYVFSWPSKKIVRTFPSDPQGTYCGWSPDGKLSLADLDKTRVLDPTTGKLLEEFKDSKYSDDERGKKLYEIGQRTQYNNDEGLYSFFTSKLTYKMDVSRGEVRSLEFFNGSETTPLGKVPDATSCQISPDGKVLAVVVKGGVLLIDVPASLATGKLVRFQ